MLTRALTLCTILASLAISPLAFAAPSITSLSATSGGAGASVTITGTSFGSSRGTSTVTFNGTPVTTYNSWNATTIKVLVPTGATTGNVVVTVGNVPSNGVAFTVTAPSISSLSPTSGAVGASVTINGNGFGSSQVTGSSVTFNGTTATPTSWSATQIKAPVPSGATTGNVVVTVAGLASNGKPFTVKPTPSITSISPTFGAVGILVTISGTNFGTAQPTVQFNGVAATPSTWSASQITVPVPNGATSGKVVVHVSGVNTNGVNFNVLTLTSIAVTPANLSVPINSLQRFAAIGTYSDGSTQNLAGNVTWSSSNTSIATIDTTGVLTAVAQGQTTVQTAFGSVNGSTTLNVKGPSFQPVGSLNQARWEHTATLLPNGQVLVVGGLNTSSLASAELYDPIAKTFSFTGSLGTAREGHTATLLPNGKVLIAGGASYDPNFGVETPLASAEIYDPQTGAFTPTGSLHSARHLHSATLLNNGKVLIVGTVELQTLTMELYDPATGTFTDTGILLAGTHPAVLLSDGTVLLAGGGDLEENSTASAQVYDPVAGAVAATGSLNAASIYHTLSLLNSGRALVAGGRVNSTSLLARTEQYDPIAKTFTTGANLALARWDHTATLMPDGTVLAVGGNISSSPFDTGAAELFDPSSQVFIGAGSLACARSNHTATLLNDGTVLVVGGAACDGISATAELYAPPLPPPVSLQITPATTNMIVGQTNQFKVFDELGRQRFDVTWAVSDPTIASLTAGGAPTLTALFAGQVTLTANVQGVVGQLQITIAPSSLQVTPATANMQVGDARQFTVVDNLGNPSTAVTWTVSDTTIASTTTDNQTTLTALATGQVTLTANVEGVTSQAQVTVWAQGTIPPGTALWSSPPLSGFAPLQIAQAVSANTLPGPDLYSVQVSADGTQSIVQALTSDGQQMLQKSLPIVNGNSVPDGSGGLIVTEHNTCLPGQTDPMTIVDLDALTGQPNWQIPAAGIQNGNTVTYCYPDNVKWLEPQFAARNDGSVVIAAMTNNGLPPLMIVIGGEAMTFNIPSSISTQPNGTQFADFSPMGPPIVDFDGSTYLEYEVRQVAYPPKVTSAALYLLKIAPDNSTTTVTLSSTTQDENLLPGRIIPDGQGGVLAAWTISPSNPPNPLPPPYQAVHVVSGTVGTPFTFPFAPKAVTFGEYPTLVLGESGTAYATDGSDPDSGPQIVAFDINSGSPFWSYQASTQSTLSLIASAAGNGLAAKITLSGTDTVIRFDSTGDATTDPLTGIGIGYFVSDLWTGVDSAMREYTAAPVLRGTSNWFQVNQRGANQAVQHLNVTNASTTGANESAIVSAFRGIKTILDADAQSQNPRYVDCRTWLGANATPTIQNLLIGSDGHSYNIGHATIWRGDVPRAAASDIGAFTGLRNGDNTPIVGLPAVGFAITVNDGGAFFSANSPNGRPWQVGARHYPGNTLRAQATILVHELSHALSGPPQLGSPGFQHDIGDDVNERANDHLVDQHCRRPIEDLDNWFWIETAWLPPGAVNTAYAATLTARGGAAPYVWSITQGALPAGLALNPATGAITGTPAASGIANFTVQVLDSTGAPNTRTASETYSIQIP